MRKPAGLYLRGGYWHIQKTVTVGTAKRKIREATGCTEGELEAATERLKQRIFEVETELRRGGGLEEHSFAEAAEEYIMSLEQRGKATSPAEYALMRIVDTIGDLPLSHVHQGVIRPWANAQRGTIKSGTVARTIDAATSVLNHAARVLRDGNRPWLWTAVPRLQAPDWGDKRKPYRMTWEEQDKLVAELPDHLSAPVLFSLATGAREQEVVSLRWTQECQVTGVPKAAVWWVPPEVRKGNARRERSEQEGRYLVCNAMERSMLDTQRGNGSEYVFPGPAGDRVGRFNNHGFRSARERAGLPIRWHDLRHTFGERAAAAGIPEDYRATLLGHTTRSVTLHYSAPGLALLVQERPRRSPGTVPCC